MRTSHGVVAVAVQSFGVGILVGLILALWWRAAQIASQIEKEESRYEISGNRPE